MPLDPNARRWLTKREDGEWVVRDHDGLVVSQACTLEKVVKLALLAAALRRISVVVLSPTPAEMAAYQLEPTRFYS